MVADAHPYTAVLFVTAVASAVVAAKAWRYRPATGATSLSVMLLGVTQWLAFHALELAATDPGRRELWADLQWIGAVVVPVAWVAFALAYTGRDGARTDQLVTLLALEPLAGLVLLVTNRSHELLWGDVTMETVSAPIGGPVVIASAEPHVGTIAHVLFSYVLFLVGTLLLVQFSIERRSVFRWQGATIVVGVLAPVAASAAAVLALTPLDLTPLAFAVTGVALTLGLYRYRLLDLAPVAHDRIVQQLDDSVIVFDRDDRIVELNEAACGLLDCEASTVVGLPADEVFDTELVERYRTTSEVTDELAVNLNGETRHFVVRLSNLTDGRGERAGRIAVLTDITAQKQRERELERANDELAETNAKLEGTNERLEAFTAVVSHDLRNPLTVAAGYLELARESTDVDDDHLAAIRESHDRMQRIVDDLLVLAQQGIDAGDCEPIPLSMVAQNAWTVVDTGESTLAVDTERIVEADPTRLQQVFENLFRNAVEHNDGPVTLRVGDHPEGFFVEDDGRGIPAADRERLFESGVSDGGGTGLGLAIVDRVAEAHGWDVQVTDSHDEVPRRETVDERAETTAAETGATNDGALAAPDDGQPVTDAHGARFEFSGV
ncbi:histidine kinase N-terminal 7TM domain-containing protein [Haloarchaeobius sp. DFWS5]|uniref:histidine kinase N-terminal 7TM domain-containing protein n=1 Tax=Haloarchaeobius sp. DFWS5 TaxID=3446114 RepID=UPI003EC0F494